MDLLITEKLGTPGLLLKTRERSGAEAEIPFLEYYWRALQEVNDLQREAERKAEEVVAGNAQSFHEVVIAMEKAALGLQLLARFQNKAVEAYQEIMRLQL
ncbi:MAG: Flagellar hook-basal body complex protein FliE [Thermacetogenium phaeum]|jgi:flagellar hook-basal body complex protein FliE|uniref:Flagellar hook-basal body complex protein FliE n=1 Tax=Thermacetogenium phaeum TaxID=85874 RepID=A0A101FFQ9_9THEO|nr:MAG: Flagellar hook-basal body complex protein FliE [Thermacetogenium phaeum]